MRSVRPPHRSAAGRETDDGRVQAGRLVPRPGFEPGRGFPQRCLRPPRLPVPPPRGRCPGAPGAAIVTRRARGDTSSPPDRVPARPGSSVPGRILPLAPLPAFIVLHEAVASAEAPSKVVAVGAEHVARRGSGRGARADRRHGGRDGPALRRPVLIRAGAILAADPCGRGRAAVDGGRRRLGPVSPGRRSNDRPRYFAATSARGRRRR